MNILDHHRIKASFSFFILLGVFIFAFNIILISSFSSLSFAQSSQAPKASTSPKIYNVVISNVAGTTDSEYTFTVPKNTTRLSIQAVNGDIWYAWVAGQTITNHVVVLNNTCSCQKDILLSSGGINDILYLASPVSGAIAQIQVWR
jgi:hypothetical protein